MIGITEIIAAYESPFCNTLLVVNDAYEMNVTPRRSRSVAFTYIIILFL